MAGKRNGLSGTRSGLFVHAINIIHWARQYNNLKYAVWENVPGVFSSNQGADFSEVLRLFTGYGYQLAKGEKWQTSGIAVGEQSICEWRTLDAQYFGVPQRRRRVFAFVDFTETPRTEPVLFESESLYRDTATGQPPKQDIAGTLEARTNAGGFPGTDGACASHIVVDIRQDPVVSNKALTLDASRPSPNGILSQRPFDMEAFGQYGNGSLASTLKQRDYKDATDLVVEPVPIHDAATRFRGKRSGKQDGKGNGLGVGQPGDPMNTLTRGDKHAIFSQQGQCDTDSFVRRLTPVECERLQGIPDDYTKIPYRNKPADHCPDTPRYRAIGNAMAVPVMHWIGKRIASVCNG